MPSRRPLEKKLSYRLNITPENESEMLASVAAHWDGFTWETGRTIVAWVSETFGTVQVWAIDESEGRGVVEHALAHMGADETAGEWIITESTSPRFGRVGTVRATIAAVRSGPHGATPHRYMIGSGA